MTSDRRLKVGIDFGTTFSGVSWIYTAKPEEVFIIKEWPGGARSSEKVPSEITYTSTGEVHRWGFEIKPSEERLAWIKLLLDPTQYTSINSTMLARTKSLIPNQAAMSKEPVDVVGDYLRCLRGHILETLVRSYGKAFLEVTPIDYTLTVPAIWTDSSKALTLQAAEAAGFGNKDTIQLMSEPDAAAAWTLLKDIKPNKLKVNDAFVVVDCGGGTVDLISYVVERLRPTFTVQECAKCTGKLCGSSFLNQNFEDFVKSRVGGERFHRMKTGPRNRMLKEFEEVLKRSFSNSEDDDIFTCPIGGFPDDPIAGIEDGGLVMTRQDMRAIFDPVINQIIPLVQEQINMVEAQYWNKFSISAVLLVGGFGASRYLLQQLEKNIIQSKQGNRPIEILQPVNAWSAVARGAALGIRITSRRARRHYGIMYRQVFQFRKHPLEKLIYCPFTGEPECTDSMRWYIKQGDEVSEDDPISFPFFRQVDIDDDLIFTDILYESEENPAPEYMNQTCLTCPRELCTLISDLSTVPKRRFQKKFGKNQTPYYEVDYNLVMTVQSAVILFHLEFKGKRDWDTEAGRK